MIIYFVEIIFQSHVSGKNARIFVDAILSIVSETLETSSTGRGNIGRIPPLGAEAGCGPGPNGMGIRKIG